MSADAARNALAQELAAVRRQFGVRADQVERDLAISLLLAAFTAPDQRHWEASLAHQTRRDVTSQEAAMAVRQCWVDAVSGR